MENFVLDVIIVGGGPAGLNASYCLRQKGLSNKIFERGKIGESWRSNRWLAMNLITPIHMNTLWDGNYPGNNPEDFCSSAEFVNSLEEYVSRFQLPVEEKSEVLSVEMQDGLFRVKVLQGTEIQVYMAKQVIIASGARSEAKIPPFSKQIAVEILQLHAGE